MAEIQQDGKADQAGLSPEAVSVLMGISPSGVVAGEGNVPDEAYREHRKSQRVKASLRCSVLTTVSGRRTSLVGYTEDVSTGGIGWYSSENLPNKHTIALRLEYQYKGKAECLVATGSIVGKVLSAAKGGFRYSIRFDKVSDAQLDNLNRFIEWRIRVASA